MAIPAVNDLRAIIARDGTPVQFTTGAASITVNAIVGTLRKRSASRAGGRGNESTLSLTLIAADLGAHQLTNFTTRALVCGGLWLVEESADSQIASGVRTVTLGPINSNI